MKDNTARRAIIFGASSGIGRELAFLLSGKGYRLGLMARRLDLLTDLKQNLPNPSFAVEADISRLDEIGTKLEKMISDLGGIDLMIICAGTGFLNPELDWQKEKDTIDVNVLGFAKTSLLAVKHFIKQGYGQLAGISSIAALVGGADAPAYNASKAFVSNYLEGLRHYTGKTGLKITITDIRPGLVDTAMAKGDGLFWVMPPEKTARQVLNAIVKKRKVAYVTKRWALIAFFLRLFRR